METKSLKALANKVLQRNQRGNSSETKSFHDGEIKCVKVSTIETQKKQIQDVLSGKYIELTRWLKSYPVTADEIKEYSPELYQAIQDTITEVDNHFLNENLHGFNEAMGKVKEFYLKAVDKVNSVNLTRQES